MGSGTILENQCSIPLTGQKFWRKRCQGKIYHMESTIDQGRDTRLFIELNIDILAILLIIKGKKDI
jgi:hypothetical protein